MKKIVFYDTETTGLPSWKTPSDGENQPHIVSLTAIQCNMETREIIQRIDLIVRPNGWEIPQDVVDIHGITTEKALIVGITEPLVVMALIELCLDSVRVSHNRTFDKRIIRIALKRYIDHFGQDLIDIWAEKDDHECTMLKAKPIMELPPRSKWGWKNPKLEEAYKFFCGMELCDKAHSSIYDTEACMFIYWSLLDYVKPDEKCTHKNWKFEDCCPDCGEDNQF